ncbi:MAG TPA: endolytic transglycosylase MltG [Moraxellaceae bacterium]|nr:endolytic transglycosylase MltG [Moraxellaceae bacterium]
MKRTSVDRKKRWLWPLLLFLAAFLPSLWIYHGLYSRLPIPDAGYRLEIARGGNLIQVAQKLERDGIIPDAFLARLWLRLHAGDKRLYPGVWLLRPPQTTASALSLILEGSARTASRLTVVEGISYRNLRDLLAARDDVKPSGIVDDAAVMAAIGATETHPEGLFAPDTYEFGDKVSDVNVLHTLYLRQKRILQDEWDRRAPGLPYSSPYEALIMASIVEKETGQASERAEIAGVFVRRLRKGMRLQTDPTVIYGIGPKFDGNLRRADLLRDSPYNTYRNAGLPPTPISLPGRAAIHAALHPASGDALFFVARGDGSHEFNATLEAHNRAVERFQKRRQASYRSSPLVESSQ